VLEQARIVLATASVSVKTISASVLGRLDRPNVDRLLKGWAQELLDIAEMKVDVHGRDAVDWSRAYIVMSNHQSLLDIPVIAVTLPGSLRFVAKKELFRIPLWGPAMARAGIISIDRQDRQSAIESLRAAGEALKSGVHIWIAPEGTRSLDGQLGKLKKGGFQLAIDTGAPILPMVIDGTKDARKKHSRQLVRGVTAKVTFGKAIEAAGRDREELMRAVESFFRATLS